MTTLWKPAAALALAAGTLMGCAVHREAAEPARLLAYVGSDGAQLRVLSLEADGRLAAPRVVAEVPKSRWLIANPAKAVLYVAIDGGAQEGSVAAFSMDRGSGALQALNAVPAGGSGTTFLSQDAASATLLAANFGSGTASSIAVKPDGSLDAKASTVQDAGSGPHRRQAGPHAHAVTLDPSGRFALVSDMGADRVFVYGFDRARHQLVNDDAAVARAFAAPPGSGPRRAMFGASGRVVYVLNELSAELMILAWDGETGRLTPVHTQAVSSEGFTGAKSAAEIAQSRDGRFIYVADRGEGRLIVYRADPASGQLTFEQRIPSGGDGPWAFDIDPSGHWLLVANYRSNQLNLFAIDPATGRLSDTGQSVASPGPVSVAFVRASRRQQDQ
ncbi:lactonase family protein [Paucibacter sp. R3-3]|uniref:Lactonase family protein n=1 Tax=Roseateles agri TaxID=3098619 RepID=A0ABU5DSJ9_9BURK|nr:lactonase family protein [Paucibacter sp. R3-3]MDY0749139.1 lactonase family protein [Paucibacter sp. R3-3]